MMQNDYDNDLQSYFTDMEHLRGMFKDFVSAEKLLAGKSMNDETIQLAQESILAHVGFRSSPRRASSDYRRHIVEGLFKDVFQTAWGRAQ
jgi:CO/xanthine dehydrogenase FAD-binding subunit